MREIKFRAWSKGLNKMLESVYIGSILCWDKYAETHIDIPPDAVLMQYTGLKDKNGVEIYEGDVFRFPGFPKCYEVRFEELMWTFTRGGGLGEGILGAYDSDDLEVIGNIWENPELVSHEK